MIGWGPICPSTTSLAIQIDGLHLDDRLLMIGAVGIDVLGEKHPLGVIEGATENTATVQALLDNLIERGLDPEGCYLFTSWTAPKRSPRPSGVPSAQTSHSALPDPQGARNITDRLDPKHHAAVRRALKQAWELDDADKAERLMRNLARRLEMEAPDVSKSILEGIDES